MMKLRPAEESDIESILQLYAQPCMDDGNVPALAEAKRIYNKMKDYPDYQAYVAELDGKIVGTFCLAIMDNIVHGGAKSGLIEAVVVDEGHQGKGVGKQLMEYAAGICRREGCYKVMLSSGMKREGAHGFYESLGFKKHGYSFLMEL